MQDLIDLELILLKINSGQSLSGKEKNRLDELRKLYQLNDSGQIKNIPALARILNKSRKTIYVWKKEGMPVEADGCFDPVKISKRRGGDKKQIKHAEISGDNDISAKVFWDTEFRKFRSKLAEIEFLQKKGELISRSEADQRLVERATEFKKALLEQARRLSLRLANKDAAAVQKILSDDSMQILKFYSRTNPVTGEAKLND